MQARPFMPSGMGGDTLSVTATATSVNILAAGMQDGLNSAALTNYGPDPVFILFTDVSSTANAIASKSYVLLAGSQVVVGKNIEHNRLSVVCAATKTASMHYILGTGM